MEGTQNRRQVFYGPDRYARFALHRPNEIGGFGDSDLFVAARGLSDTVIPDLDDTVFDLRGEHAEEVERARKGLLEPIAGVDLWDEPSLAMELRSWVGQLIRDGELFVHFEISKPADAEEHVLLRSTWLAPETIIHRQDAGVFEQFASRRVYEDGEVIMMGEPKDFLYEIPEAEVLHLRWPLPGPSRPGLEALRLGRQVARGNHRSLLYSRSGAEPTETFLPLVRARAGAYGRAIEETEIASARIKDLLLYPGTSESLAYPWAPELGAYFAAERVVRAKIAICRLRAYLFEELNRQVLHRWCGLNGWAAINLGLSPELFSERDWQQIGEELKSGELGLEDVLAAMRIEWDAGLAFGQMAAS